MGTKGYEGVVDAKGWTGRINFIPERLKDFEKGKGKRIFVGSMSDLFHPNVHEADLVTIFRAMIENSQHTYYVLTKRPQEIGNFLVRCDLNMDHIFLGVTVEDKDHEWRIETLCQNWSGRKFVSCEPLLSAVDIDGPGNMYRPGDRWLRGWGASPVQVRPDDYDLVQYDLPGKMDWVIVGGETGPGARPMHPDWVRSIRDQCQAAGTPFFFKSWGEYCAPSQLLNQGKKEYEDEKDMANFKYWKVGKKAAGRLLDGKEHSEIPEVER